MSEEIEAPDTSVNSELLAVLRNHCSDANEREAVLVDFIMRTWAYVPLNLIHLPTGRSVTDLLNERLKEFYDIRLAMPEKAKGRKR